MKKKGLIILIVSIIILLLIIGGTTTAIVVSNQKANTNLLLPDIEDNQVFDYDGMTHKPEIKNASDVSLDNVSYSYAKKTDDTPEDEVYTEALPKDAGSYFIKIEYKGNTQYKTITINPAEVTLQEISVKYTQNVIYGGYFTSLMNVSEMQFDAIFVNASKEKVEGKVSLDTDKLDPAKSSYDYTFKPTDSNYNDYHGQVDITVYARVFIYDSKNPNGDPIYYDEVVFDSLFNYHPDTKTGYNAPVIKDENNNVYSDSVQVTSDLVLYRYDEPINYTITYNLDGGENGNNPLTYNIETESFQLQPATKLGYTFKGWFKEATFENQVTKILKGTINDIELFAYFDKNTYEVTYLLDGGINSSNNPLQIQVTDSVTLEPASKTGYTFVGWYLDNEKITKLENVSSNITLTAVYEINSYTIHFESNGGTEVADMTLEYDEDIIFDHTIEKNGYTFVGWYTNPELTTIFKLTKMPAEDITLYARYSAKVYTITYELNGAEENQNPDSYTIETPTIVLKDAVQTGYSFAGWYLEATFDTRVYEIELGSTGNITLYAKFAIDVYQITFHSNGGTEYPVMNVEYNTSVNLPTPEKNGYEFAGWFKNEELTIPVSLTFTVTETLDLYAKYTLVTYAITYFNVDGLENNNPTSYTVEDDTFALLDVPKAGYTFLGWYSDDSFETKVESITKPSVGNKELYAKFEAINYAITYFNVDGLTNPNPATYTILDEFVLQALTKPGYTFKGWYLESTFENSVLAVEKGTTGPQEFYAKFELDTYTIIYNLDGTNAANPDTYTYETDTIVLLDPTKSGYDFIGWYLEDTYETKVTEIEKGSTGNKVFYAKFEIHTYTITYENVEDATNTNPDTYTVDTPTITLVSATKLGYDFGGWYLEDTFTTRVYTIEEGQTGNVVLFAKFDLVTYTITYNNVEGATNTNPATYTIISDDITLQNPEKTGYAFEGWYLDEEFNTAVTQILKGSTGNKVFYAKFILEGYTITYHNLEGATNGDNPLAYSSEDETIVLKDATKPGYTFVGWYLEDTFDTQVTKIDSGSTGNREFYAKFEIVTYTITYNNVEGATNTNPVTYTVETPTFALTNATKDYYTFAGWYLEDTFETEVTEVTLGQTGNKVFYAKFTPVTYTITYNNVEGAENTNPTEYTYESAKITLVAATKDYYTFGGWYLEDTFTTRVYQIDAKSYGNKEFYAKFTPVAYTITYNAQGGVHTNPDTYTVEDAKITLTEASKTGYTFDGWYLEDTFETKVEAIEAGSHENKVFYAKFSAINYAITYNYVEGATNTNPATYTILSDDIVLQDAAKAGYTFDGWYLDNTFTTRVYKIDSGSTGNLEFYAKFTVITYTITYHVLDGATNTNPATYTVETPTFALANATKDYYNFIDWYKESTFETAVTEVEVGTTGNMDLYAKFETIVYTITYNNVEGATNTNPTEYTYESAKITLANATKDYYTFAGWYLEDTFSNRVYEIDANSNGNKEFYAKWTPITYTITYMNLEGATNGANPDTYTVEDATFTLLDATKTGYDFAGWYLEADFQTQVTEITLGSHDNKILYAKFTPSTNTAYTVKHLIENIDGTYQIHQTEPKTGTTGNLTQAEFMTIAHFTPVGSITQVEILADGSTIVELRYSRDSYTVSFEYRSGLTTDLEFTSVEKTIKYQQEIGQFPIELTIDKYSYEVFDTLGNTVTTSEVITGDVTYYVDYTLRTLSIAYHNVDVAIPPVEASAGTSVTLATASKAGYDFGGWATTVDGAKVYDSNETITMPSESMDLYAIWTVITYSITYNLDGATNTNPATYTVETPTITLLPATKDGYTFLGWFLENSFNTEVTEIALGTTGDQELFAKFEIITYTITYNNIDGATNTNPATYTVATPTITLVDATKTGYDFVGWYLESTFNTAVTTIAVGSMGDKVLYAKFEAHDYTITYNNVEGATNTNPVTYTVEDATITLVDPTKTGYTFAGWYSDSLFANRVYEIEAGSTGDQVFYAKWTPIIYAITYNNVEGATNTNPTSYTIEDATITLVAASKTGYDFAGWYLEDSFTTPVTEITSGSTGPKAFYAKFEIHTYTITYNNVEGATNTNPATFTILSDTIVLANASKTGYDFAGWYTESTFENPVTQIVTGTAENKTFYAKFVAHTYTITYNVLDGTTNTNPTTYTIETATITLANASKTGYTFNGWYLENTYNTAVTEITLGTIGDLVFYAKQTVITYTISYNLDEGVNGDNPDEFTVESSTIVLNEATKTGYDFVGWYTESTYDNQVFEIEAGSHDSITLYAKFEVVTYTITYELYEGTNGDNPATYTVEDATITLEAASKTGYDFVGWYLESTFENPVTEITTGSTGNKKFYAKFNEHVYTITYNNVDGLTNTNPTTYKITSDTIILVSVAKAGYTFDGWYTEATLENAVHQIATGSTGNKVFYAKFSAITYTITYNNIVGATNGANPATYTVETPTFALANATKTGYTFVGWYSDSTLNTAVTEVVLGSTGAKTFYAKWQVENYTITYNNVDGATNTNPVSYNIETPTITLVAAEKNGYTFDGWYLDNTFTTRVYELSNGSTGNKVFYAKFTVKSYTITYNNVDGATNTNPTTYTIETETITLAAPTKAGYDFVGWYLESTFNTAVTTIAKGSSGNKIFYAKFTAHSYSITYQNAQGITNTNPTTYTIEDADITLQVLTKTGYDFAGWYLENTFTTRVYTIASGSTGDKVLYAKFTATQYTITYYNCDGATNTNPATYTIEDVVTLTNPTKSGYTFVGWYLESTFNTQASGIQLGSTGAKAFYAKFESEIYTITYVNCDGATNSNPASYTSDDATIVLANPTMNGYNFIGWYLESTFNTQAYSIDSGSSGNKTFYAKFEAITYTITYNLDGGTNAANPATYTIETPTITLLDATKSGFEFYGWYKESTHNTQVLTIPQGSTGNLVLYAYFDVSAYHITYVLNGGTNNENNIALFTSSTPSITLQSPTKGNAYTFAGWFLDSNFETRILAIDTENTDHDVTVYAKWTPLQYTILYYDGSERITTLTHNTYTFEDEFNLESYSKFNFTFNGWYTDPEFTHQLTKISSGTTGTIKLYAKTTDKGFNVKFYDTDATTLLSQQTCPTYGSVTAPEYTYDSAIYVLKWVNAQGEVVELTNISSNLTLHAQLVVISYNATVYFVDADGYAAAKTSNLAITNTTSSALSFGANISLTRQMRVTDASTYDFFYMSPVSSFDWDLAVKSIANGAVATNAEGTMSAYVTIADTTGTLTIYVYCIQPVAIMTSSTQTLAYENNLNLSTSTYQFYKTIDEAFEAFANSSSKLLRIYGRQAGGIDSDCLTNASDKTIPAATITVNEVTITRPKLVYKASDYTLHNSYSLSSGKIVLPYYRTCTDTIGYRNQQSSAASKGKVHSLLVIDSNVTLDLSIDFTIGGDIAGGSAGVVYGRAVVINNGTIIQNAGTTLTSFGFLKGSGKLIMNSGSVLIDFFKIYDWVGGRNAKGMYEKNVFPISCYSFHNVSCETKLYSGANFKVWNQVNTSAGWAAEYLTLVGNGGLFQLTSGYIVKSIKDTTSTSNMNTGYTVDNSNSITVKDILEIHGDFYDNTVSITLQISITTGKNMAMPIGFMEVNIEEGNGVLKANSYKFLPGSKLNIGEKATLTIQSGVNVALMENYIDNYAYTDNNGNTSNPCLSWAYQAKHSAIYSNNTVIEGYNPVCIVNGTLNCKGGIGGRIKTTSSRGILSLSSTSISMPMVKSLSYGTFGNSCTTENLTLYPQIYLNSSNSFNWANASATSYSSICLNDEYGFTVNANVHTFTLIYYYLDNAESIKINTTGDSYTISSTDLTEKEVEGYTFGGWYIDSTYTTEALGYTISANQNLYAKMTPILYNVEYRVVVLDDYDETEPIVNTNATYFTVTDTITLQPASCGTLQFYGWYVDSNYTVSAPNISSSSFSYYKYVMENNTIILYGYLSSIEYYAIAYVDEFGQPIDGIETQSILAGESITLEDALASYNQTEGVDTTKYAYDEYVFSKWEVRSGKTGALIGNYNAGQTITPESNLIIRAIFVKNKTYVKVEPGDLTNASYTVSSSAGSGSSEASFYVPVGTSLSITFKFTQTDSRSYTITPAIGNATSGKPTSETETVSYTVNYNSTIAASSQESGCVAPGTLITMADGTLRAVEEITLGDMVMTWNFFTGQYEAKPVIALEVMRDRTVNVITVVLENGKTIDIISYQSFFDFDTKEYFMMNGENYLSHIGRNIAIMAEDGLEYSKIVDIYLTKETTNTYEIITANNFNFIANGILTVEPFIFNINFFTINEDMKYDSEEIANDIQTYGLFDYSEFAEYFTEEEFNAFNGQYFKIAIAKGLTTLEHIFEALSIYKNSYTN